MLHVSRKMIMWKSKSIFNKKEMTIAPSKNLLVDGAKSLCESMGSLLEEKIKTATAQKDPSDMVDRIVVYVIYVDRFQKQFNFQDANIIAMNETPVWNNMVSNITTEKTSSKDVSMKSTSHDKVRVSVCLTGKADGIRLKPLIVFKGAKRESKALHVEFHRQGSVASLLISG